MEITFGETRVILPGDIGKGVEELIVPSLRECGQTLLVAAHHGSKYSNSEEFLDALKPRSIVFSCGYDNQFGFPSRAVLERCAKRNIPIYRTDMNGAVHAVSNGREWTVSSER